jgi:hypothetical protein
MACGGGEGGKDNAEGTENGVTVPAPASSEFAKLKFGDKTVVSNGAGLGMKMDEVKKLHGSDPIENEDENYLTYTYKFGTEEYDHEYMLEYSFDSETGKAWQVSYDISMPDAASAKTLYSDIVANFDAKYGKGKSVGDKDWEEMEWKGVTIDGQKTDVSVQRMIDSEVGYILLYFEESYE